MHVVSKHYHIVSFMLGDYMHTISEHVHMHAVLSTIKCQHVYTSSHTSSFHMKSYIFVYMHDYMHAVLKNSHILACCECSHAYSFEYCHLTTYIYMFTHMQFLRRVQWWYVHEVSECNHMHGDSECGHISGCMHINAVVEHSHMLLWIHMLIHMHIPSVVTCKHLPTCSHTCNLWALLYVSMHVCSYTYNFWALLYVSM